MGWWAAVPGDAALVIFFMLHTERFRQLLAQETVWKRHVGLTSPPDSRDSVLAVRQAIQDGEIPSQSVPQDGSGPAPTSHLTPPGGGVTNKRRTCPSHKAITNQTLSSIVGTSHKPNISFIDYTSHKANIIFYSRYKSQIKHFFYRLYKSQTKHYLF